MAKKRIGLQTVRLEQPPVIIGAAAVAGPMEAQGPLGHEFDQTYPDLTIGQSSFERAERQMMIDACNLACKRPASRGSRPRWTTSSPATC